MARSIKAKFIAEYGSFEQEVLLMAPDLTLELCEGEWTFRKVPAVRADQDSVTIKLDECPVFSVAFPIEVIRMLIEVTNKK